MALQDVWTVRAVLLFLGTVLLIAVGGFILLPIFGREVPREAVQLITLIAGGFLTFLNPLAARVTNAGSTDTTAKPAQ